ncbi:FAD-dependent oxidoreductase [Candidatus Formimonas warabiya]|uniref:FAD-dependent oxidoreductase n=1 Tax=Formimonas warabiya TaxID=1761012 RepID=UPI003001728B
MVVVGGGWAGCAASLTAKKAGADEVLLIERCDMLLGTGLVGGIMRNNGRYTAAEEGIAMGCGELFEVADHVSRHKNIEFPGHKHAFLYDITAIEPAVKKKLLCYGVDVLTETRITDIKRAGQAITSVITAQGREIPGDIFVETTGTAGPAGNCAKFGNGCVMCIYRCPTFGPRVSIAGRAGIKEKMGVNTDGSTGAMSGSCKLHKESLSDDIIRELQQKGVVVRPIPEFLKKGDKMLARKACQQYAGKDFADNVVLLDTGHAKLMSPYFPLELLRQVPGFEKARFEDPYSGGIGNSIRFLAISPVNRYLQTKGLENLFCAGEKAGPLVGHTEAIITGSLAGHNGVRQAKGFPLIKIPETLACGDILDQVNKALETEEGLAKRYTFSGGLYFQRMQEKGTYSTDREEIKRRVDQSGMMGIFDGPIR